MNHSPEQPSPVEQTAALTSEQLKNRLADLVDGEFKVRRSDGTIETGWAIVGAGNGPDGKLAVGIMKPETNEIKRGIDAQELLDWQKSAPEATPSFYTVPVTETDSLEQARIDAQAFANEVNAHKATPSVEALDEGAGEVVMGPHEEIVARTMARKAMEDRLGPLPGETGQ